MGRVLKVLLVLFVVVFVAVTAFGYIGDLSPKQQEIRIPVTLSEQ